MWHASIIMNMNHLQLLGVIDADRLVFGRPILVTGLRIGLIPSLLVRPGIKIFNWESNLPRTGSSSFYLDLQTMLYCMAGIAYR